MVITENNFSLTVLATDNELSKIKLLIKIICCSDKAKAYAATFALIYGNFSILKFLIKNIKDKQLIIYYLIEYGNEKHVKKLIKFLNKK